MDKWIKNTTASTKTWVGQEVSAGAYHNIEAIKELAWANDSTLLSDIGSGEAVVAKSDSGSDDITDVNDGINYLKSLIPREVSVFQSSNYQINHFTKNLSLPKVTWTSVYTYSGSGFMWSWWTDLNSNRVDMKFILDTTIEVIPSIELNDVSGFGGSGQAVILPLVHLGNNNFAFTPQEKIRFSSKVELFMKTNDGAAGNKQVSAGYIGIVKES